MIETELTFFDVQGQGGATSSTASSRNLTGRFFNCIRAAAKYFCCASAKKTKPCKFARLFTIAPPAINMSGEQLANGWFLFAFTNNPGRLFSVLTTTNVSLPLSDWNLFGTAAEISAGQFQFTVPLAISNPRCFLPRPLA